MDKAIERLDELRKERHDLVEAGNFRKAAALKKEMCAIAPNHRCDLCRACRGWKVTVI